MHSQAESKIASIHRALKMLIFGLSGCKSFVGIHIFIHIFFCPVILKFSFPWTRNFKIAFVLSLAAVIGALLKSVCNPAKNSITR